MAPWLIGNSLYNWAAAEMSLEKANLDLLRHHISVVMLSL